jgi:hypothetical protein
LCCALLLCILFSNIFSNTKCIIYNVCKVIGSSAAHHQRTAPLMHHHDIAPITHHHHRTTPYTASPLTHCPNCTHHHRAAPHTHLRLIAALPRIRTTNALPLTLPHHIRPLHCLTTYPPYIASPPTHCQRPLHCLTTYAPYIASPPTHCPRCTHAHSTAPNSPPLHCQTFTTHQHRIAPPMHHHCIASHPHHQRTSPHTASPPQHRPKHALYPCIAPHSHHPHTASNTASLSPHCPTE